MAIFDQFQPAWEAFVKAGLLTPANTVLSALLGWWLKSLHDKKSSKQTEIKQIGDRYIESIRKEGGNDIRSARLHCLQHAGAAQLQTQKQLDALGIYIRNHGHIDPTKESGWENFFSLLNLLKWAAEKGVNLKDDKDIYTTYLEEFLFEQNSCKREQPINEDMVPCHPH